MLYAMEEKNLKSENRFNALLIAYAFLLPINMVLDNYKKFAKGTIGT